MWQLQAAVSHPTSQIGADGRPALLAATGVEKVLREMPAEMEQFLNTMTSGAHKPSEEAGSARTGRVRFIYRFECALVCGSVNVRLVWPITCSFTLLIMCECVWWTLVNIFPVRFCCVC